MPTAKKAAAKKVTVKKATAKKPVIAGSDKPAVKPAASPSKLAKAAAPPLKKKSPSRRELIEPHQGDKRYVRRQADGTFGHTVDVGKSLSADSRSKAKTKVPKGQGDRGDTRK